MQAQITCQECGAARSVYPSNVGRYMYCSKNCHAIGVRREWAARFWTKVDRSGECWLWLAALTREGGYGLYGAGRKGASPLRAHRVAWELLVGPIPKGMCLLHQCDVDYPVGDMTYRRCVRPNHLRLGTREENQREMVEKGRSASGDRNASRRRVRS